MDQSFSDLKSNTSKPELSEAPDSRASTLDDFWYTFRIFAFRLEKFVFDHWYIFPIIIFLSILLLNGIFDHRLAELPCTIQHQVKSCPPRDYPNVTGAFTSRIFLVSGGLFALILWLFNKWRHSIPRTFQELLSRGYINSLKEDGDVNKEYQSFLEEYQKQLLSNKRYIFPLILTIIYAVPCFIALQSNIFPQGNVDLTLQMVRWSIAFIRVIVISSLLGYFSGIGLWAIASTSVYIKNLTSRFKLTIVLNHPDHCGGLQSLGNSCLYMALPILVGAVFFGIYGIGDTVLIGQLSKALNGSLSMAQGGLLASQNQIVIFTVVLIMFALILASNTFFLPLSNIHREMVIKKQAYDDEFAELSVRFDKKIRSSLDKGKLKEATDAKKEMEILQGLYPDKISFPTWPFDFPIVFTFVTIQIPAVLSLVGLVLGFFQMSPPTK